MQDLKVKYLSNKRTLLSVPGTLKTDAYFTEQDSTVHLTELTSNLGRYVSSLTSSQFGATSQVIVPNNDILGETYLHLTLPTNPGVGTTTAANYLAPLGWGWSAIKSISYLWGASNVAQISISGKSLWAVALAQCDTSEKRSQLCYLGGAALPSRKTDDAENLDVEGIGSDAYIPLALPWSVLSNNGKIGFDTSLLNSPITIQIQFAPASEFLQWSSTAAGTVLANIPSSFDNAEIVVRQHMFSDRSQSLKFEMQNNPTNIYHYPFKHFQSFQKDFSATTGVDSQVQLTNFINADLIGMVIYVVETAKLKGGSTVAPTEGDRFKLNPLDISLPYDVKLLFNGQVLYNSPGKLYLLQNCAGLNGSGSYYSSKLSKQPDVGNDGVLSTFSRLPIIRDMIFIDFSRKHSLSFDNEFANTFRIAQQTLDLTMKLPKGEYTLFATYVYNGVNAVQQGSSNLYFD
ncbi:hypothetical protein [Flavobacterium sp.]|uniref:hypothetical protein n=1 Tax=Flavobacterium sp. TaxID=239 RepID=UPI003750A463